jgi:hypothetical protein
MIEQGCTEMSIPTTNPINAYSLEWIIEHLLGKKFYWLCGNNDIVLKVF